MHIRPTLGEDVWKRVKANKGAAGIDGLTIDRFVAHFGAQSSTLIDEIRHGRYQPYPVKHVYIEKDDGVPQVLTDKHIYTKIRYL